MAPAPGWPPPPRRHAARRPWPGAAGTSARRTPLPPRPAAVRRRGIPAVPARGGLAPPPAPPAARRPAAVRRWTASAADYRCCRRRRSGPCPDCPAGCPAGSCTGRPAPWSWPPRRPERPRRLKSSACAASRHLPKASWSGVGEARRGEHRPGMAGKRYFPISPSISRWNAANLSRFPATCSCRWIYSSGYLG